MKKRLNTDAIKNELEGSVFFPIPPQSTNVSPEEKPENLKSGYPENPKTRKEDNPKGGNQGIPISGNPEILNTRKQDVLKVPKYYTQLPIALQDEIKVYAIRHKLNDYEVVIHAVEAFLKKQK